MAQMLYPRNSTALHLNAAQRHQSLCRRFPAGKPQSDAIQPLVGDLKAKRLAAEEADLAQDIAEDEIAAADYEQDNAVRNLFAAAESHDRDHPTEPVLGRLFPTGRFGDIVEESLDDQPDEMDKLAGRAEALPAGHPLRPRAAELRTRAQAVRTAISAALERLSEAVAAEGAEEVARAAVREQYRRNYLNSQLAFGRATAERLFPELKNRAVAPAPAPVVGRGKRRGEGERRPGGGASLVGRGIRFSPSRQALFGGESACRPRDDAASRGREAPPAGNRACGRQNGPPSGADAGCFAGAGLLLR